MSNATNDMTAVIEAARGVREATVIDVASGVEGVGPVPMLIVPLPGGGLDVLSVKDEIDAYRDRPERRTGTARFDDLESFIAHANRFKDEDSAIFTSGDPTKPSFLSVIDYHQRVNVATDGKVETQPDALPRFARHRGSYTPAFSTEWIAWTTVNGKPMSQAQFAELIQTRARDIFDVDDQHPDRLGELAAWFAQRFGGRIPPAEFFASSQRLLDVGEGLTVTVQDRVGDVARRDSGETRITFESERSTDIDIPVAFVIEIPVFRGGDVWQLPVRLRFSLRSENDVKRAQWKIELFGVERTVTDVVKDMGETVKGATGLPVFVGAPET